MAIELWSYEKFLGQAIRKLQSEAGISDLNPGSVALTILEAIAEGDAVVNAQILSALDAIDIDRAENSLLDLVAAGKGLRRYAASKSSGPVTLTDASFSKINTTIYQGAVAPIIGSTVISVNDASLFPSTGSVYLGRGTVNVEGPIPYSTITQVGNYYTITLDSATGKYHATSESVILSQGGDRSVSAGSSINTGKVGASSPISFTILNAAIIPDGEDTLEGVSVICSTVGTQGNIPSNALTVFPSPPFPNLQVNNDFPYTNARDQEGDIDLRDRIKKKNSTSTNGTNQSILNAITNLIAPDEQKRVLSASIIEATGTNPTVLYLDDGQGYEPILSGVGQEIIVDNDVGGKKYLQLINPALVKAQISSISSQPFALEDGCKLVAIVGGVVSEHVFATTDFIDIASATTYETVASINANSSLLFSARTAEGASKLLLSARGDVDEDILISAPSSGFDANSVFNFQSGKQYTLKLYKNDNELVKDGSDAVLESIDFPWGLSSASYTLKLEVDGTPEVTYTFSAADLAPYLPSTAPLSAWVTAINAKVPGVTAATSANRLQIGSNRGANDLASIAITGGTLVTAGAVFAVSESVGHASDYSLIRGTGQIILTDVTADGDTFKAGTAKTRAYIETSALTSGVVNVAATGNVFVTNDATVDTVASGAVAGINITVANVGTNIWRYTGPTTTFANAVIGQWAVVWDSGVTNSNDRGYFRVSNTNTDTYIDVEKAAGTGASYTLLDNDGFQLVATDGIIQNFKPAVASQSLSQWVNDLNGGALVGITAEVADTNRIRLTTNTYEDLNGKINLLSSDNDGQSLEFVAGDSDVSATSHIGFSESANSELGTPLFLTPLVVGTNNTHSSSKAFVANASLTVTPDRFLGFVKTFNTAITNRFGNNRYNWNGIKNKVNGSTTVNLVSKSTILDRLVSDRAYIANSFDLADSDQLLLVLDNAPTSKSVKLNTYRTISITSSPVPNANSFSALDVDSGNALLNASFGGAFDFSNYKLWSRARAVVDNDNLNDAFVVRAAKFGPDGNLYKFFLGYPYGPNTACSYSVNVGNTVGGVDLTVILPSDAARTAAYGPTTSFTVSNVSGTNYQFNYSAGTAPAFVANGVIVGDIVNISTNSNFTTGNQGIYRVTNVSATSFRIQNPNASATAQSVAVVLGATSNLQFYPISSTATASGLITWMNSNVNSYITTSLGDGQNGSTTVNRIIRDFVGSTLNYVSLAEGENWVSTASLTTSPQFTTEVNSSFTAGGFCPLVGEQLRLIPRTAKQIAAFISSPAVSPLANMGEVKESSRGGKIQIASNIVGTSGAVKIDGGAANAAGGSIVGSSTPAGTPVAYDVIRTTNGATNGIHAGSWLKLTSALPLSKNVSLTDGSLAGLTLPNLLTLTGGNLYTSRSHSGNNTTRIQVEKHGDFACFIYTGVGTAPVFSNVLQGDWVVVDSTANFDSINAGTYRVVRAASTCFWVENAAAVEQDVILSAGTDFKFYSSDSVLTGDSVIISGGLFGTANDGAYTVATVSGTQTLTVDTNFAASVSLTSLSGNKFTSLNFYGSDVSSFYRPVTAIASPSAAGTSYDDIVIGDYVVQLSGKISDSFAFVWTALNKLAFPTTTQFGIDGYNYYKGLIGEATKVIYGDSSDAIAYPGIKASAAYIDIRPPLPKRVVVSVGVRLKTGTTLAQITGTIKSSVASVINGTKIGESIPLGKILSVVGAIDGVFSPSIIYPVFNSTDDVIVVKADEKPLVINQDDISVSLLGN